MLASNVAKARAQPKHHVCPARAREVNGLAYSRCLASTNDLAMHNSLLSLLCSSYMLKEIMQIHVDTCILHLYLGSMLSSMFTLKIGLHCRAALHSTNPVANVE